MSGPTSTRAFLQEVLDDLGLGVVAGLLRHHGAELAELAEKAVLVVELAQLERQSAALTGLTGRRAGTRGGTGLRS